jgi:hypothetical protein
MRALTGHRMPTPLLKGHVSMARIDPFDDAEGSYQALNGEGQHSLWPFLAEAPASWSVVHGPA